MKQHGIKSKVVDIETTIEEVLMRTLFPAVLQDGSVLEKAGCSVSATLFMTLFTKLSVWPQSPEAGRRSIHEPMRGK